MGEKDCCCGGSTFLVYPCSGGADTGEISDRAARKLSMQNIYRMSCLAGIGGQVSGLVASARGADGILVIDGCPLDCAAKTMMNSGISGFEHLRVTDLGFTKGSSPATEERIDAVVAAAMKLKGLQDVYGNVGCCCPPGETGPEG
jgi:uncharacterized metal-binding protein